MRVRCVAAGEYFSLVTMEEGTVSSFGVGEEGVLGHGNMNPLVLPKKVEALCGIPVTSVAAGHIHALAATEQGAVYSWGCNVDGELGIGREHDYMLRPMLVPAAALSRKRVLLVEAGGHHSCAITDTGVTWGSDRVGALGLARDKLDCYKCSPLPQPVHFPGQFVLNVAAGAWHTLVALDEGTVMHLGCLKSGLLEPGCVPDVRVPRPGPGPGPSPGR